MDRWYKKYKSNEIVLSDRKPDVSSIPEDAPAGAFARLQKRKWKLWLVINDLYNPTSVKNIFVRSGVKNDWVEYIPPMPVSNDDWKLLGNSGTNPSTNFLGTTDAQRLVFRTNNTERATILSNGNFGIGTSSPLLPLTVANNSGNIARFTWNGTDVLDFVVGGVETRLENSGTRPFKIRLNSIDRFTILGTNGFTGINTTAPTSNLQVNGSYAETITVITATTTLNDTHNKIVLNNGATNITITLPNALTCIGRKYEFSRYAGSTGSVTVVGTGSQIQALAGTVGATTTLGAHSAAGAGLKHSFTAVNIGGVGVWVRL